LRDVIYGRSLNKPKSFLIRERKKEGKTEKEARRAGEGERKLDCQHINMSVSALAFISHCKEVCKVSQKPFIFPWL
jgi:hypothetical protein